MSAEETYEAATAETAFPSFPRNIRIFMNATTAVIDVIPSQIHSDFGANNPKGLTPEVDSILVGAKPIVESDRYLRVRFRTILSICVQEEFIELVPLLARSFEAAPRLNGTMAVFPFLKVSNSRWKALLLDHPSAGNPGLDHYKMLSMETHIDVIGQLLSTKWMNSRR